MPTKKVRENPARVYIPIEEEFLDVIGATWKTGSNSDALDLRDVLSHTVFRAPVKTGEDSVRTLHLIEAINESENGAIEFNKQDFDWMIAHFRETAHLVWAAPDAAFLLRHLETVKTQREPEGGDV